MADLSKSTAEWKKTIETNKGEFHADDYEVGAELYGWKVVIEAGDKYWYWGGELVSQKERDNFD